MKQNKKGYSVKPGRMGSAQAALGSIFGIVFSIIWTAVAISAGAPWFFALFGIMFVVISLVNTAVNIKNAVGKNRYSKFDVLDVNSEPDPWDEKFGQSNDEPEAERYNLVNVNACEGETRFCPYCGTAVQKDFEFCKSCGRQLPD